MKSLDEWKATNCAYYEKMFGERGGIATPSDPIEFHFFHLVRYWSRLVGFCKQCPERSDGFLNSSLGAYLQIASDFADKLIDANSPISVQWKEYRRREQSVLYGRPVSIADLEAASRAFDECLAVLNYDAWRNKRTKLVH